jgi:signal transduction histidine kinase
MTTSPSPQTFAGPERTAAAAIESRERPDDVVVLAPTGRDGPLAVQVLARWGLRATAHRTMGALCDAITHGAGTVVVAEEALGSRDRALLETTLAQQPAWSDIPVVVITAEGELSREIADGVESIALRGNVTLVERPVRIATLVTAVRSALRARRRQYDQRDNIDEIEAARAEADEANRAKSQFLAVMSHELRTPLNAIGGYAELIELGIHGPLTDEQREALHRVQKSQRHLLGLINGVLNYARIEIGSVKYEIAAVPVEEVLTTCEALTAPQARSRGLILNFGHCEPGLRVLGDREKVQQILLNLLSNAIKFTEPGGQVTVSCTASATVVQIQVADTGPGIAMEKQDIIFEPFVQVDTALTRTQEGIGLGLAISRDLARGMNGDLTLDSQVGRGSSFTLSLPRAQEQAVGGRR